MEFEGKLFNREYGVVDNDPTHRLCPVPKIWSKEARKESFKDIVSEQTLDYVMKAWAVTEDDTIQTKDRRLVLEDDEIEALNILLHHPEPLSTAAFQELLPDIDLRETTQILLDRNIITNDALAPLNRALARPHPTRLLERGTKRHPPIDTSKLWRNSDTWSWSISPTVSINDHRSETLPPKSLAEIKQEIDIDGFAILDDEVLGNFGVPFRKHLLDTYFNNPDVVKLHEHDMPRDRKRARAVARTAFLNDGVILSEHSAIPISSPKLYIGNQGSNAVNHRIDPNIVRPREYSRLEIFKDPTLLQFIHGLNELIPERHRPPMTTFGINAFRTKTDVVSGPHQDGVNYVFVYVVDVKGVVPRTKLHARNGDGYVPRARVSHPLQPGQLIAFKDRGFYHYTSRLIPGADEEAQRDVMVFTADNPAI